MATSSSLRHSRGSQSARAGRAAPAVRSRRHPGCRPARPALSFPSRSSRPRSRPAPVMVEISVLPSWTLARKGRRAFPPRVTVRLGRAHAATSRTRVTRLLGPGSSSRALEPPRGRLPSGGRPSPARRDREDRVGNGFSTGSFSEKARVRPPTVAAHEKASSVSRRNAKKKATPPLATLEPATVRALNRARPSPSLPIRADTRDRAAPPLPDTPGRRVARVASRRAVGEKAERRFAPRRKENKAVRRRVSRPRRVAAVRRGVRERNEPEPEPEPEPDIREDTRGRDARACRARRAQRRPAGGGGGGGGGGRVFAPAKTK
jgi:hypothetical protein